MGAAKASVKFDLIGRREIPALERRGAVAQDVLGDLVMITFHHGGTDIEDPFGVAVEVPESMRKCRAGVSDTVVVASLSERSEVSLLDVMMVERRSLRGLPWRERLEILGGLHSRLTDDAKKMFPLARRWSRGLVKVLGERMADGGGLLIRVPGKNRGLLCMGDCDELR